MCTNQISFLLIKKIINSFKNIYMNNSKINLLIAFLFSFYAFSQNQDLNIGLNAKVTDDGEILFDGTNKILHSKWTYWEGPRLKASLPIKWELVNDPINKGMVLNTFDSAAIGGAYGTADIVTKKKYKDFRLHIEFLLIKLFNYP